MIDREKVIKGLECCRNRHLCLCNECPYFESNTNPDDEDDDTCTFDLNDDTLALLKEQETVDGHWIVLEYCANEGIYCSKCMNKIFDRSTKPKKKLSNYCPNCGSKNTHFFNPSTEKTMYSD